MTRYLIFLLLPVLLCTCDPAPDDEVTTAFDRGAMLGFWSATITDAFDDLSAESATLAAATERYLSDASAANLTAVQDNYETAYLAWQRAAPFMVGPAGELRLTEQLNIYPTDTARLLSGERFNLELPSNNDVQGFPALDYLLYGIDAPETQRESISFIAARIAGLTAAASTRWVDYDEQYRANSGNSATASVDRTVNEYIFWYEKHLRAGKVGIPAGVFSSTARPELTETFYRGDFSKALFLEGLETATRFFNQEQGLATYLDALDVRRDGSLLSSRINANFAAARAITVTLDDDFGTQVRTDNTAMLRLHDALQANVILLKVDMLQALGINVDFVDADGD